MTAMADSATDNLSSSILIRARRNEPEAWHRLTHLYASVVYGWVRRGGVIEADAADVVQDVFLEVARCLDRFDHKSPGHSFSGWLYTITRRRTIDFLRRRGPIAEGGSTALGRIAEAPDTPEPETAPDDPTPGVLRRGLELIRDEFEQKTWRAFELTAIDNKPAADAAAELGLSVGAVYVAKSRVLKKLREVLDGLI
jgi:RNA polymerase sigma-70 factor, ECF subfamily